MRAAWCIVLIIACSGDRHARSTQAREPEAAGRCQAMTGHAEQCARDLACMMGGAVTHCSNGGPCTMGGPVACLACTDWIAVYGAAPAEFCTLRAAGRRRDACLVLFPDEPSRCDR